MRYRWYARHLEDFAMTMFWNVEADSSREAPRTNLKSLYRVSCEKYNAILSGGELWKAQHGDSRAIQCVETSSNATSSDAHTYMSAFRSWEILNMLQSVARSTSLLMFARHSEAVGRGLPARVLTFPHPREWSISQSVSYQRKQILSWPTGIMQVSSWMSDVNDRLTDRLIYIRQRFLKYRKKSHVRNHMFKSHKVKSFYILSSI